MPMAPAPGTQPGAPGRCAPVSSPTGACSGCVQTAAEAPPRRGGAHGGSFDTPPARPNLSRAQHAHYNMQLPFPRSYHATVAAAESQPYKLMSWHPTSDPSDTAARLSEVSGGAAVSVVCWRVCWKDSGWLTVTNGLEAALPATLIPAVSHVVGDRRRFRGWRV